MKTEIMHKIFILLIYLNSLSCFGQNEEKGCTYVSDFSIYSQSLANYKYPPYDFDFYTKGSNHVFVSNTDTIEFELSDTNAVNIVWNFWDEVGIGPTGLNANTPHWYKNDTLLESTAYSSYYYLGYGGCGTNPQSR